MRFIMTRVAAFSASSFADLAWSFASFFCRSLASFASAVEEIVREAVLDSRASMWKSAIEMSRQGESARGMGMEGESDWNAEKGDEGTGMRTC